jgi:formylglycine-generating enzyme
VVCISPCSAIAYCKWAGKHLCGKVGGGPIKLDKEKIEQGDEAALAVLNEPDSSQLYNACSQGGKTKYPYGSEKQANVCPSQAVDQDVAASACHGTKAPFDQIINLAGGVAEWEWTEPLLAGGGYVARGLNNYGKEEEEKNGRCDTPTLMLAGSNVGFRCCLDPD